MAKMIKDSSKSTVTLLVLFMIISSVLLTQCGNTQADSQNTGKDASKQEAKQTSAAQSDEQFSIAPDFALEDLNGDIVRLSDYRGKVVFINFWATWCPPCRVEIPYFIEMIDEYGDDGFEILGIDLDPRDFAKVPAFVEQEGINYPVMYDTKGVSNLYGGIQSIPTTFVVNRNGKVVERIVGSRPKNEFVRILKNWL